MKEINEPTTISGDDAHKLTRVFMKVWELMGHYQDGRMMTISNLKGNPFNVLNLT